MLVSDGFVDPWISTSLASVYLHQNNSIPFWGDKGHLILSNYSQNLYYMPS